MIVDSSSRDDTLALGERIGRALGKGDVVALSGELGAGKTAFVQGLARGLHVGGRVTSPTFTIVNEHEGPIPLFHVDFYRLEHAAELINIGFEEYFERGGVVVVEWAERYAESLPAERLDVRIEITGAESRRFHFTGPLAATIAIH